MTSSRSKFLFSCAKRLLIRGLGFCLALLPAAAQSEELLEKVKSLFREVGIPSESVSIVVQRAHEPSKRLALNADLPRNPASLMKVVTSFAALETFGPAHTWQVRLVAAGEWEGETLQGTLILEHDNDPLLTAERLWELIRTVQALGLKAASSFCIRARALALPSWSPESFDGERFAPYTQGPAAALAHLNALAVHLVPHPSKRELRVALHPPGYQVDARAVRLTDESCSEPLRTMVTLRWAVEEKKLILSGRFPRSCKRQTLYIAPPHIETHLEALFTSIWRESGGVLAATGCNLSEAERLEPFELAASRSETLASILMRMNHWSNNVLARQLLALVGQAAQPESANHVAAGARAALKLLQQQGLDDGHTRITNGSGLSRDERLTANSLARLLAHILQKPYAPELIASLPLLGREGTAKRRYLHHPLRDRMRVKTGSLADVRAIAGYLLDDPSNPLIVVIIVEHPHAMRAAERFPELLTLLASAGER